jgi:hypothetical protein
MSSLLVERVEMGLAAVRAAVPKEKRVEKDHFDRFLVLFFKNVGC